MLPQSSAEHYRSQQRLTVATLAAVRAQWARMGEDFDASWRTIGPRLLLLLIGAQLGAARGGVEYVPRVLAETGQDDDPVGEVNPRAFAGEASDGRPLDSLLYGAVIRAKEARREIGRDGGTVSPVRESLDAGGRWLDMAVQTQVADANRGAVGVSIAARPSVTGYVRMLNTPSCSRCVVLAGKFYRWNKGFRRHENCDCKHIPASEDMAGDLRTDPLAAIKASQVTGLSRADARAILEDGADVNQVINARRGMTTAQVYGRKLKVTTEGVTKRGLAGKRLADAGTVRLPGSRYSSARTPRLRPESIYDIAEDRADAVRLLRRFGYIT